VPHVLVVAHVEDPAADAQGDHDADVLQQLGLKVTARQRSFRHVF
jgi:hypothetical protein